jgi:pimeloyl-ACP methyl ester carboxylesterase
MTEITHRTIKTNGIDMHIAEAGVGKPVIFVHGFPELSRSWRKQLPVLADAGYHAIAPDMRGYGKTSVPGNIEDYDIDHLTGDLCGLLDDLGVERAFFVGHDWGAWVMWHMTLLHPERVEALVNISVPFSPRGDVPLTKLLEQLFGDNFFYILYFQKPGPADQELSKDVRKTVLRFAWATSGESMAQAEFLQLPKDGTGFLDQMTDPAKPLGWFTEEDLDYFVGEFERTGYSGGLNWYRNIDRNWHLMEHVADARPTQPVLFIAGENDPVIRMAPPDGMRTTVPDLRGIEIVPAAGHWVHMQKPEPVNEAILRFLKEVGY